MIKMCSFSKCFFSGPYVGMVVQAYDQHLNMILGEVEEVVTSVEIDDETYEEIVRVSIGDLVSSVLLS